MRLRNNSMAWLLAAALVLCGCGSGRAADGDPPYDAALVRLAEILGALHYLRPLCGTGETTLWRDRMDALIAAEAPQPERRAALVAAFNRSYSSFAMLYRSCTPAAATAIERYVEDGAKLSRDITTRYGR